MNKYTIFIGNPGTGKSTLLNSLIGKTLFHAGVSWGQGLTTVLQLEKADNGDFFGDTPGLADAKLLEQAAAEISSALRSGEGDYKLVFVVTEEAGRVRPSDGVTMKVVLDALPKDRNVPYGIIVNKLTRKKKQILETDGEAFRTLAACLNEGRDHPTAYIHLYQRVEELEDATDELHPPTPALVHFLQVLPSFHIQPTDVRNIRSNEYYSQVEKLEVALVELIKDKKKVETKMEKDREDLEKEFARQMTMIREDQDKALAALHEEATKSRQQLELSSRKSRLHQICCQTPTMGAAGTTNRLTVIQAEPTRWRHEETGEYQPIPLLDSRRERETIEKALGEAKSEIDLHIDLEFKYGTTDNLSAAITTNGCRSHVLHLSCHGTEWSLILEDGSFEDGSRGAQFVEFAHIAGLIASARGVSLGFVFVAACHSRKLGEELVNEGVPHVLCCEQETDKMMDDAITEFSRAFYRALATGKTLKFAFDHAKEAVRLSPDVADTEHRKDNYVLLPERNDPDDNYHNVTVFSELNNSVQIKKKSSGKDPFRTWELEAWFTYPNGSKVEFKEEARWFESNNEMVDRLIEKLKNHKDSNGTPRPLSITQQDHEELRRDLRLGLDMGANGKAVRDLFGKLLREAG